MRSRAVRLTLTLLAVLAIPAAAYIIWNIEQRETTRHAARAAFEQTRVTALRSAFEVRAAQQAYVAAGQSEAYWFEKTASLTESVRTAFDTLQRDAGSSDLRDALAAGATALRSFEQVDKRARNYAASGQKLLASDVIFSDALTALATVIASLEQAGAVAAAENTAASARAVREKLMPIAAAAAALVIVILLLLPAPEVQPAAQPAVTPTAAPTATLDLRPARRVPSAPPKIEVRDTQPIVPPTLALPAARVAIPPEGRPTPPPAPTPVDVQVLAELCTDLARLSDTDRLPAILERTAQALDASGLILWVSDPDGAELVPVASHGYAASVLARLGTIKVDAENATAAAFRTGLLQTVAASEGASGAIAAPLVTASGCRGVMSAEVRKEGEKQAGRLAAACIVAAQLATLVGPLPAAAADSREAAM